MESASWLRLRYKKYERFVEQLFYQRQKEGLLSASHDMNHVKAVANAAVEYGLLMAQSNFLVDECYVAALLHDICREKRECGLHHSVKGMEFIHDSFLKDWLIEDFGKEGLRRVSLAVGMHSISFNKVWEVVPTNHDESAVERLGRLLRSKQIGLVTVSDIRSLGLTTWDKEVVLAVLFGDKVKEQRGFRIIRRRSRWSQELLDNDEEVRAFIGRVAGKVGLGRADMLAMVFVGESLMRLYVRNRFDRYPEKIQKVVGEEYMYELSFIYGVATHVARLVGTKVEQLPRFYASFKYPRFIEVEGLESDIKRDRGIADRFLSRYGECLSMSDVISDVLNLLVSVGGGKRVRMASEFGKELEHRLDH